MSKIEEAQQIVKVLESTEFQAGWSRVAEYLTLKMQQAERVLLNPYADAATAEQLAGMTDMARAEWRGRVMGVAIAHRAALHSPQHILETARAEVAMAAQSQET